MYINQYVCVCVFTQSHKMFRKTQNHWFHFAVNGLKCQNARLSTTVGQHIFFRLDILKKIHCQTPLYRWFSRAEHWISSSKALPVVPYYINYQTISSPSLWSFHLGKQGPSCRCLQASTHSLPGSQPACSPRFLSQVRVKVRSHTMDCSWIWWEFFFSFSQTVFTRFVAVHFSSQHVFLLSRPWCSATIYVCFDCPSGAGEAARVRKVAERNVFDPTWAHTRIFARCGRECVPHLQTRSLIRPGLADGEDLQEYWDGWRDSDPEREWRGEGDR